MQRGSDQDAGEASLVKAANVFERAHAAAADEFSMRITAA